MTNRITRALRSHLPTTINSAASSDERLATPKRARSGRSPTSQTVALGTWALNLCKEFDAALNEHQEHLILRNAVYEPDTAAIERFIEAPVAN